MVTIEYSTDQDRELLSRILASATFQKAPRARGFLQFVAEMHLAGRSAEINEYSIGVNVFGKPADFDPGEDTIVRVGARQLRAKLKEYFDGEGREEDLILHVPKGSYTPVFEPRPRSEAAPRATRRRRLDLWSLFQWAAITTLLVSTAWLGIENHHLRSGVQLPQPSETIMRTAAFSPGNQTLIVVADSGLVARQVLLDRKLSLGEYVARNRNPIPDELRQSEPRVLDIWRFLTTRYYTSVADLKIWGEILKDNPDQWSKIEIVHARSLQARDFQTNNVIVLGSSDSVPWAGLFEENLNFRFESVPGKGKAVRNLAPKPGEQPVYANGREGDTGRTVYAVIAVMPNLGKNGRVVLIAGSGSEATESAARFALNPVIYKRYRSLLKERFEILLRTSVLDNTNTKDPEIVAYR